jgi:hypothetical protein
VRAFRPGRIRILGGREVPEVGVLVGGFLVARGHVDDDHVPDPGVGPRDQVGQPGLLLRFPPGDGQRVGFSRIAVPADLQPGLLALVPAQQHPRGGRVHDQHGRGDVQRKVAPPGVTGGLGQGAYPVQIGRLGVTLRLVAVQEFGQGRPRGRFHGRRCYPADGSRVTARLCPA